MGRRWALFEKVEAPDYDQPDRNFMVRWRIIQTPWAGLFVHRINMRDPRPTLHTHPWGFLSLIVRGSYRENRLDPRTAKVIPRRVRWINRMHHADAHAITDIVHGPVWTLVFAGRLRQRWGYWEPADHPDAVEDAWTWTPHDQHPHYQAFLAAKQARALAS